MEHIQKYKIEDESLDDQPDNYIYSQNSYSSNIQQKNVNIISNNSQQKTINVSQPKIQITELNKNSINSNKNKTSNKPKIQKCKFRQLQKINIISHIIIEKLKIGK